ncbi:HNH endonuclease [Aphanizomenon flos-aquae]|uniref:HNH endonuclease n=1 Tax=Aphanizomenon flos-aquae TaxID=1176 RepID=UPI0030D568F4
MPLAFCLAITTIFNANLLILKILISKLTQLHLHHKKSKAQGGGDNYGNLILVYLYYH